jgi:hypothetical protein
MQLVEEHVRMFLDMLTDGAAAAVMLYVLDM